MIPLVASVRELDLVRHRIDAVAAEVEEERGVSIPHKVGTMIELPRAAVTAGQIAESAEFFSFGTNDLTQMTWGFSRDDVEAAFFSTYLEHGVFPVSPFESLDTEGVGALVRTAAERGRATRPDLHLGVCGEHGGDPASIHFFDEVGLDYVSCSPFRVPVARLEAGRAVARRRLSTGPPGCTARRARAAAQKSAEARFLACPEHARVVVADGAEEPDEVLARPVALVAGRTPDQVDQPVEGVVDLRRRACRGRRPWSARRGRRGRGSASARAASRSTPCVRCSSRAMASPAAASVSAGLASTQLLVLRDGPVDVAVTERVLGGGVARVDLRSRRGAAAASGGRGRRGARLVPAGDALGGQLLHTWVSAVRSSSIGTTSWSSGIGRPSSTATTSGIDGICMACAIAGAASMSTSPTRKRPSNSPDSVGEVVGELAALGHPARGSRTPAAPAPSSTPRWWTGSSPR